MKKSRAGVNNSYNEKSRIRGLTIIEKEDLVERSARLGEYLHKRAGEKLVHHPSMGNIRGNGLLMGIELVKNQETKEPFEPAIMASVQVHRIAKEKGCMVYPTTGVIQGVRGDRYRPRYAGRGYHRVRERAGYVVVNPTLLLLHICP